MAGGDDVVDDDVCDFVLCTNDRQYVVDGVTIAGAALDLDGDGLAEDVLNQQLATLLGPDWQSAVDRGVDTGVMIHLLHLRADAIDAAQDAGIWLYLGTNPSPAPCADPGDTECRRHLDGLGSFELAADSPTDAVLHGPIAGGLLSAGPTHVTMQMSLGPSGVMLIGSDSSASPRKQEIQAHINQLDDPDYGARCAAMLSAKRRLPGWVREADSDDGRPRRRAAP
jgi:hypothetical protein